MLFDLDAYDSLMRTVSTGPRPLVRFSDAATSGLLLRLDVDYSLDWAVETARINAGHGIKATYFILLEADLYNPLSPKGNAALLELQRQGQFIGLHHQHGGASPLDPRSLRDRWEILKRIAPQAVPVVSWHNPEGDLTPLNDAARKAGLLSAYDPRWCTPACYRSDSNLRHSPRILGDFVVAAEPALIQLLLHPINWVMGGDDMREILLRAFAAKAHEHADAFSANTVWRQSLDAVMRQRLERLRDSP